MKPIDLKELIHALLTLIFIAMATGIYDRLAARARREALGVSIQNQKVKPTHSRSGVNRPSG